MLVCDDVGALERDELVTALVHHDLALEALVALAAEAPYAIAAHLAHGGAREPLRLVLVAVDQVDLAPAARASPVDAAVFAHALGAGSLGRVREHVHDELALLVHVVEAQRFVQLHLAAQRARIALLVHPLDGEQLLLVELAYVTQHGH